MDFVRENFGELTIDFTFSPLLYSGEIHRYPSQTMYAHMYCAVKNTGGGVISPSPFIYNLIKYTEEKKRKKLFNRRCCTQSGGQWESSALRTICYTRHSALGQTETPHV